MHAFTEFTASVHIYIYALHICLFPVKPEEQSQLCFAGQVLWPEIALTILFNQDEFENVNITSSSLDAKFVYKHEVSCGHSDPDTFHGCFKPIC